MRLKVLQMTVISVVFCHKLKMHLTFLEDLTTELGYEIHLNVLSCCKTIYLNNSPLAPLWRSGVTSPRRTRLNFRTSSTWCQKVDFFIGETGTSSTRTRQDEVMSSARSISLICSREKKCNYSCRNANGRFFNERLFKIYGRK